MKMSFDSSSDNEAFARSAVAAFILPLDPTVAELGEIRTAVSEAVTNCVVHAYGGGEGTINLSVRIRSDGQVCIRVRDSGCGIENVDRAMEPLYTTASDPERAGLGFAVMQSFSDSLRVRSSPGRGTVVTMIRRLSPRVANA